MSDLKSRVAERAYTIDCDAVAQAFLARQSSCSKPVADRSPSRSARLTFGAPATIRPTAWSPARPGGPQAHSS